MLRALWQEPGPRCMLIAGLSISAAATAFLLVAQPAGVGIGLVSRDSAQYWGIATNLAEGRGFSFDGVNPTRMRQPVYPLLLAGLRLIFGPAVLPVQIVQAALCIAALLMMASLATELFGSTVGGLTGLFIGLYYPLPILATRVYAESVYIALLSGAVVCWVLTLRRPAVLWAVACGGLFGLASLCRPTALIYLPILPLAIWAQLRWRGQGLQLGVAALAACGVVLLPWALRNYAALGSLAVKSDDGPVALWLGVHPMTVSHWGNYMREIEKTEEYWRLRGSDSYLGPSAARRFAAAARERILHDPLGVLKRGTLKTVRTWTYLPGTRPLATKSPWLFRVAQIPQILILVLAAIGAARSPASMWSTALILFVATSAGCFLGPATARYVVPLMPLALLLSTAALVSTVLRSPQEQAAIGLTTDAALAASTEANPD